MIDRARQEQSRERSAERVACAWALVMLAAELKVSLPYIHWIVSVLAFIVTWPYLRPIPWRARYPARIPARLFALAICVPILYGARVIYSVAEAGKLAVILLGAMAAFVARPPLAYYAFRGFILAVYVNALLLLAGCFGFGTAGEMAWNRWGTFLSWPGSLARVGGSVWVYAAYLLVKRRSPSAMILLAAATFLIYMDGSRTELLLLLVGAICLMLVFVAEAGTIRRAVFVGGLLALVAVLIAVAYSGALSGAADTADNGVGVGRLGGLVTSVEAEGAEGLEASDVIRYQMLQDALDAIRAHPVLGTGIETTASETLVGPMAIHMTYLQVWADVGLLGFVAHVWLMWGWIPWMPRALRQIAALPDPIRRAVYYNALYLLLAYGLAGLFHPLSTEWSEWVIFIIPYAMVWNLARPREDGEPGTQSALA